MIRLILLFSFFFFSIEAARPFYHKEIEQLSPYQAKDFSQLIDMPGFDKSLLEMHFKLYEGYVKNANFLLDELRRMAENNEALSYEFGALKRRLGWEMDGMRLHELYFTNLGRSKKSFSSLEIQSAISQQFGSFDAWKEDFISTGLIRGIGWVILYLDKTDGRLINMWINEHDTGHLAGGSPLLVMDVWEHAYITQFGLDRKKYIYTFFNNVNWSVVNERFLHD